jgi:DNA modification methylase
MAPGIAIEVLSQKDKPLRVLDPMMGSGTVLALAQANGHETIGIDIDPLAVLISKVWTRPINKAKVLHVAKSALECARQNFSEITNRHAYPKNADEETKKFIDFWFDPLARRQMTALSNALAEVKDRKVRDALWCSLSRLIIVKKSGVSLAMDLSHSRPHKVFEKAPIKPFDKFLLSVERVIDNCIEKNVTQGPVPQVRRGDARKLPVKKSSIDLVLTSPPYLNAIDYMRCSKFSLVWMGYSIKELRKLRTDSIGTEVRDEIASNDEMVKSILLKLKLSPRLNVRDEAILSKYIHDMTKSVNEVTRVLAPQGKAVYVLGENLIRGTYIRNSALVRTVAELAGLSFLAKKIRVLPANRRYLPPPTSRKSSAALDTRMRREVIMTFQKLAT